MVMDAKTVIEALANPTRAHIFQLVSLEPMHLTQIAAAVGRGVPSVYSAIEHLEAAGLVQSHRRGRQRIVRSLVSKIELLVTKAG